jgi:hypothetical protein
VYGENITTIINGSDSSTGKIFLCKASAEKEVQQSDTNTPAVQPKKQSFVTLKNFLILTGILIVGIPLSLIPPLAIAEIAGLILWIYMGVVLLFAMPWLTILFWVGLVFLVIGISGGLVMWIGDITSLAGGITTTILGFVLAALFCFALHDEADIAWYSYYIAVVVGYLFALIIFGLIYFIIIRPVQHFKNKKTIASIAERIAADSYYIETCSNADRSFYTRHKIAIDKLVSGIKQERDEKRTHEQNLQRRKQLEDIEKESKAQELQVKQDEAAAKLKRHLDSLPERVRMIGQIQKSDTNDDLLSIFDQIESVLQDIQAFQAHLSSNNRNLIKRQCALFEAHLEDAKEKIVENKVFLLQRDGIIELFTNLQTQGE